MDTRSVNHVGVTVRDLDAVMALLAPLGGAVRSSARIEAYGFASTVVAVGGSFLELMELDPDRQEEAGPAGTDARLHHVALAVDDLVATMRRLRTAGVRFGGPTGDGEITHPISAPGALHAWTVPDTSAGLMVQLTQTTRGTKNA
jgi:catechol 2,3-dioxygenase-like lactoylglutathione lyase family enzyme